MSIRVHWDERKCCHSGNCLRSLPKVFMVQDDQFVIKPEIALDDEILEVVQACPSQALRVLED